MNFKCIIFNRASNYKGVRILEKDLTLFTVYKICRQKGAQFFIHDPCFYIFSKLLAKDYGTRFVLLRGFSLKETDDSQGRK